MNSHPRSLTKNFIYSIINTVSGLLFPLFTFPYATRVLMPEGIGQVNFYNSIIAYVTLLVGMGIPTYGIREIARVRDNKEELTRVTIELLSLSVFLCIGGYLIIGGVCLWIDPIKENFPLFLILSSILFFTAIGCNWFYSGVEDFKYITFRGLIVRVIATIFLFVCVKTKDDLFLYGIYYVVSYGGSYLVNFLCLGRYLDISSVKFRHINLSRHIKPALAVFIFSLATSIYLQLDKAMLGFLADNESVGYYSAASQISHLLLLLATAIGTVMLPRASNLVKNKKYDEFRVLTQKSYQFVLLIAFPLSLGCIALSPALIQLLCGEMFANATSSLQILSPIVLIIGISNLIGMQILYPIGKINLVTISTSIGAIVNLLLNVIFIPMFREDGAAFSTLIAELSVTLILILLGRKYIPFSLITKECFYYFIASIVMFVICVSIAQFTVYPYNIFVVIGVGLFVYITILIIAKDSMIMDLINRKICNQL